MRQKKNHDMIKGFLVGAVAGCLVLGLTKTLNKEQVKKPDLETRAVQPVQIDEDMGEVNEVEENKTYYNSLCGMIKRYEGISNKAYPDSEGILTVGVGFNLEKTGAKERIEALGLDYQAVCDKKQELSYEQIHSLLKEDVETAISDAKFYLGKDWYNLNSDAQEIIIDISYNLGRNRLLGFKKLKEALKNKNYAEAAKEMKDSRWYRQTGFRAQELVLRMENLD